MLLRNRLGLRRGGRRFFVLLWLFFAVADFSVPLAVGQINGYAPRILVPDSPLLYTEGEQINFSVPVEGGWNSFEALEIPAGLTISSNALLGKLAAGSYSVRVRASNRFGADEADIGIEVFPAIWQPLESGTTEPIFASAAGDGFYLVAGAGGYIATSSDGLEWRRWDSGTTATLYGAAWGAGRMVVVGTGGTVLTSVDGEVWSEVEVETNVTLRSIAYGSAGFVAVENSRNAVWVSVDGLAWERLEIADGSVRLMRIAYGHGRYIIGHLGWTFSVSENGRDWRTVPGGILGEIHATEDGFIAAHRPRNRFSPDGETWSVVGMHHHPISHFGVLTSTAEWNVMSSGTGDLSMSRDGMKWTHRSFNGGNGTRFLTVMGMGNAVIGGGDFGNLAIMRMPPSPALTIPLEHAVRVGEDFEIPLTSDVPASRVQVGFDRQMQRFYLPPGISFDENTQTLRGNFTNERDHGVPITWQNESGLNHERIRIAAYPATGEPPEFAEPAPRMVKLNGSVAIEPEVSNVQVGSRWTVSDLPDGLYLDPSDGRVSGNIFRAGTYRFTLSVTNLYGADSREFVVTVVDPPTILVEPEPAEYVEGGRLRLAVAAESDLPLSFQWQKDGVNLVDDERISGALSDTLFIDPVELADGGEYRVEVRHELDFVTSRSVAVSVYPSYERWAEALPEGERGAEADPWGRGVPNLLAFAFGWEPGDVSPVNLPGMKRAGERWVFEYPVAVPTDVEVRVETSRDLREWVPHEGPEWLGVGDREGTASVVLEEQADRLFVRLRAWRRDLSGR